MPLTVAAVLLDNEVSFAVCGSPALAEKITELTLAKTAAVSKADYIFVTENADWQEAVQAAKCGTLRDPHKSATVILCTADLQAGKLQRISGPGIKAVQEIIMCRNCRRLGETWMSRNMSIRWALIFCAGISGAA